MENNKPTQQFRIFPEKDFIDLTDENGALISLTSLSETFVFISEKIEGETPISK